MDPHPSRHRTSVTVFFFLSGFGYSSWASRIPSMTQRLGLNEAEIGGVLLAMPVGLLLTMPFTRMLLRTTSSRKIMLAGSLFFSVALALVGFADSVWTLVPLMLCFGSSRNLLNLSMNAQAVDIQALYPRPIMTTFHGIWSLSGFAGAGLGYVMVRFHVSPAWHLLAVGLFSIVLSLIFHGSGLHVPPRPEARKAWFALPDRSVLAFALICFGSMACENTMYDWGSLYFRHVVLSTNAAATAAFVVYMVAMTSGRFLGDRITARYGIPFLLRWSGLLILAGMALVVLFPVQLVAAIGFVLVGFGISCNVPLVFAYAGKNKQANSGTALVAISTLGYLGFLVWPPVVGFIAKASSLRWSFALMSLSGLLIWLMARKIPAEDRGTGGW